MGLPDLLQEAWDDARADLEQQAARPENAERHSAIEGAVPMDLARGEERLAALLETARTTVPRYSALRDRSIATLQDFPLSDKRMLQRSFADSISRAPNGGALTEQKYYVVRTSGSTGEPVSTLKTEDGDGFADAVIQERLNVALGLPRSGTSLSLPLLEATTPLIEATLFPRPFVNWNLRGYDPKSQDVQAEYDAIVGQFDVDYVYGTSSRIVSLAFYCRDNQIKLRPKAIVASYEHLPEAGRELVESIFDCPVTMLYGTTETGVASWECPQRKMHFNDDWVHVEILDADGRPVSGEAHGRVTLTSLKSDVMPIIRYLTGDMAAALTTCDCGLPGSVAPGLSGRSQGRVIGVDGTVFSPYPLLAALSAAGLPDFQVFQSRPGVLGLTTSSRGPDPEAALQNINERLAAYFGTGTGFRLEPGVQDDFRLNPLGKRNPVVQTLDVPLGPESTGYLRS